MKKCGVDLPNVTVIHCGIDVSRYRMVETPEHLRRKHAIPPSAPVIGVVGNLRQWKGQETIVRATAILRDRYPELRCVLAGGQTPADRPYVERLQAIAAELGIVPNVIFAGFQKNAIDYMRMMDVVAHTSTSPEPFGIVTLEAMSIGKPLVSTTIGGRRKWCRTAPSREIIVNPGTRAAAHSGGRAADDPEHGRGDGPPRTRRLDAQSASRKHAGDTDFYHHVSATASTAKGYEPMKQ